MEGLGTTEAGTARHDGELIVAVRGGDADAYGELFARHADAARRLARALGDPSDADDLVSEAFTKVLALIQRGDGPTLAFRPYLLTTVRRLHVDRSMAAGRVRPTDVSDLDGDDPAQERSDEVAVAGFERSAAARALATLPERWQAVLWHTEVEGQQPAEIAPLLGMTPNAVAALAYRAREGLRQAFLTQHVQDAGSDDCAAARASLGAYVRGGLSRREARKVSAHLEGCRPCAAIYLELVEVNGELRGVLAPIVLGTAAAAYLTGGTAAPVPSALTGLLKPLAGVAAAGVTAAGFVVAVGTFTSEDAPAAREPGHAREALRPGPAVPTLHRLLGAGGAGDGAQSSGEVGSGSADPPGTADTDTGSDGGSDGEPGGDSGGQDQPDDPSPTPDGPGDDPRPPDRDAPDASLRASAVSLTDLAWQVTFDVTGVPAGQEATLTIRSDHPAVTVQLAPRCTPAGAGEARCTITGPSAVTLVAIPQPGTRTTLTGILEIAGVVDANPGDNEARVTLAS